MHAILVYLGENIDDGHAQPSLLHRTEKIEVVWFDLQQRIASIPIYTFKEPQQHDVLPASNHLL